jgi:hypothetical protein
MVNKTYETHDNGGRPFRVDIQGNKVSVWKNMNEYKLVNGTFVDIEHPPRHILDFTADKIFVGKKSKKGGYDGLKPKEAEGNSFLLQIGSKCVFIGHEIFEFTPVKGDTIEAYYSDIGNSDVPYPYAVGKTHMYILLDKVAVEKSFFDTKGDIYQQYYSATTYLPMCLKGYDPKDKCKDKEAAKEFIESLKKHQVKLKTKLLQKRL